MKADVIELLKLLRNAIQFAIPIYQRKYSWDESDCKKLWEDIIRSGQDIEVRRHFIGSVVYIDSENSLMRNESALLIDGQQRLTTITLLIVGLIDAMGDAKLYDGSTAQKLRNYYLVNPEETIDTFYKLILTETDNATLKAIVDQSELPEKKSDKILENYEYLRNLIDKSDVDLSTIWKGLQKIAVVGIGLAQNEDNPQLIFESINATGKKLSQADLIRNFILMGLDQDLQKRLYERFWHPMEENFGLYDSTQFDAFMRHYLTIKLDVIPRKRDVYEVFKQYAQGIEVQNKGIEKLVEDIYKYAKYYFAVALGKESDQILQQAFSDLRDLKIEVVYPFLLELYKKYDENLFSKDDLLETTKLIESYVFRRSICSIPASSLNNTFATFLRQTNRYSQTDNLLHRIQAHFNSLRSYRQFPKDEDFKECIKTRNLYHYQYRSYWLRRFENNDRKERVIVDEYTIEHILPQSENLPSYWKNELGENWKEIQEKYLHTLGNLTLTGYNSQMSNRSFREKLEMEGGFKDSPLRLNRELRDYEQWNEDSIKNRAEMLANVAINIWKEPKNVIDMKITEEPQKYSIEDHPNLSDGKTKKLFDEFKEEVLKLDPEIITVEYLRHYVAFKAETNVVDVQPQSNRLVLYLNMKFSEINDPNKKCRDVSNIGRRGNGDVQVVYSDSSELSYIIGLVRQSLEKQLGENNLLDLISQL